MNLFRRRAIRCSNWFQSQSSTNAKKRCTLPDDWRVQVVSPEFGEISIGKPEWHGNKKPDNIGPSNELVSLPNSEKLVTERISTFQH